MLSRNELEKQTPGLSLCNVARIAHPQEPAEQNQHAVPGEACRTQKPGSRHQVSLQKVSQRLRGSIVRVHRPKKNCQSEAKRAPPPPSFSWVRHQTRNRKAAVRSAHNGESALRTG